MEYSIAQVNWQTNISIKISKSSVIQCSRRRLTINEMKSAKNKDFSQSNDLYLDFYFN
jgi:hypothetical protein